MANIKLSQLLKIISSEQMENINSNKGIYDSQNSKKSYRSRENIKSKQENYKNISYMQNKKLNKLGK